MIDTLSPMQLRALCAASEGLPYREIGDKLNIAEVTVCRYLRDVREKLCARNTAHSVAIAIRKGIIE